MSSCYIIQYSLCVRAKCFCCIRFYKLLRFTSWREHESVVGKHTPCATQGTDDTDLCTTLLLSNPPLLIVSTAASLEELLLLLLLSPARRQIISSGLPTDGHLETNWWKSGIQKTFLSVLDSRRRRYTARCYTAQSLRSNTQLCLRHKYGQLSTPSALFIR